MRKNKKGFIMIITIILVFLISIILYIWANVITKNNIYYNYEKQTFENSEKSKNFSSILLKYDNYLNNNWLWEDILNCSWWLIENNKNWFSCLWNFVYWPDWIDDKCNNDDLTPYYYSENVEINNFTTIWSDLVDDDANARVYNIWFLYPKEEKTVFFFNKDIKDKIISDLNNKYFDKPSSWNFYNLELSINWLNSWKLNSVFVEKDINFDNIISYDSLINSNLKTILNVNWEFSSGTPYPLNLSNDDKIYALNLYNDSENVISYNLVIKNSYWNLVYQIPITYDNNYKLHKFYNINLNKNKLNTYVKVLFWY